MSDEFLIFGEEPKPPSSALDDVFGEDHWIEMMARSGPLGPLMRRRDEMTRLLWQLMEFPPEVRSVAIGKPPFRDLDLAERFLEQCLKYIPNSPDLCEEMACLAGEIARHSLQEEVERARTVRARSFHYQGAARRVLKDQVVAEERHFMGLAVLSSSSPAAEKAFGLQMLAELREDQGRLSEAVALLRQAASLFAEDRAGARVPGPKVERCLERIGFIYLKQNDPGRAMTVLSQLLDLSEGRGLPKFKVRIDLGRAACLAAAGLAEEARHLLAATVPLRRVIRDRGHRLPLEWLESRITAHLGDLDTAAPRLDALRRHFLFCGQNLQACLCAIDVVFACFKRGDRKQRRRAVMRREAQRLRRFLFLDDDPDDDPEVEDALEVLDGFERAIIKKKTTPEAALREAYSNAHRLLSTGHVHMQEMKKRVTAMTKSEPSPT